MTRALLTRVMWLTVLVQQATLLFGQELPSSVQQQLENLADVQQSETEDDSYVLEAEHLKRHPLNLNTAGEEALKQLVFLTDQQIENFLSYRNLFGKFVSIYELQAVPSWDVHTIRRVLPFVALNNASSLDEARKRLNAGDQSLLVRYSQVLEKSEGFANKTSQTRYVGSPSRIFFRYHYQFRNLLQYGITGDKDAGEQFFKGAEKYGFDFYSFHLFLRKFGKIKSLAIGDFTVNMGQGLMQWQSLAFSKSAEVLNVKRQSDILRPYSSSGEYYFHRGLGATIQFGKLETSAFVSVRRLSSNVVTDTATGENFVSSLENSGYHRTPAEIQDRNTLRQVGAGFNLAYKSSRWHIGINGLAYKFSLPIRKRPDPYNLYAVNGRYWANMSVDYGFSSHNFHAFGEEAVDKNFHGAFLNGLLISVDPRIDLCVLQRWIGKRYQAVYGDAFTENAYPNNEAGIYIGARLRPGSGWGVDMYADFFKFPWVKYLVDAPSSGKDLLVQVNFSPTKQLEVYTRFRAEEKQSDQSADGAAINYAVVIPKKSWRSDINFGLSPRVTFHERIDVLWFGKGPNRENGFLTFLDLAYHPVNPYSVTLRLQYFETNGYNSRIYAYENDVLYNFSIPAFMDKGYRYYINANYHLKKLFFWLRWSQTIYPGKTAIGSGSDEINTNHRSEIRLQVERFF